MRKRERLAKEFVANQDMLMYFRATMMFSCVPLFFGWLFIIKATEVWMLYVGRLVTGAAIGSFSVVAPIYIGEIAAPQVRGALGTMFQISARICDVFLRPFFRADSF